MSEGKQEARELRDLRAWKESAMKVMNDLKLQECGEALGLAPGSEIVKHILPALLATRQANQPQGKAQPESGDNEAFEIGHNIGFQRSQQAMAEKAAQMAGALLMKKGQTNLAIEVSDAIRSLANTEPPQGEAEKEGRG